MGDDAKILARQTQQVPADLDFPHRVKVVEDDKWKDPDPPDIPVVGFAPGSDLDLTGLDPGQRVRIVVEHGHYLRDGTLSHAVNDALVRHVDVTIKVKH